MNERDKLQIKHDKPRGLLSVPAGIATSGGHMRYWPSPDLAPFVEHYWSVRWDLSEPRVVETVPHPSIHIALESSGTSHVVGVMRTRFSRVLDGRGHVLGTKFRPGGFRPFVKPLVSSFTDRRLDLRAVFGSQGAPLGRKVLACEEELEGIAVVESFLRELEPVADDDMLLAGSVAARIADDRAISRVGQLVQEFQTNLRRLQRVFSEYVGVSPKWVIQRYRLLDAAERVTAGVVIDWADLALDLGYADQAHFIRDFKRLIGRTPAEYARQLKYGADAGR